MTIVSPNPEKSRSPFAPTPTAGQRTRGGEMGERIRTFDWARTPLGPKETWSPSLRMMTEFLLANRFPLLLWWGPQFIQIYNDAYIPVLGDKHPRAALGKPVSECWSEIYTVLEPLIQTPFQGGQPTWMEDIELEVRRYGFREETHFTIAYSPVPDDTAPGGIGGVLATVHEITKKVIGERHLSALRDLAARPIEAKSAEDACAAAAATLAQHDRDIPFALLYLAEANGIFANLAGVAGAENCIALCPKAISLRHPDSVWPLNMVRERGEIVVVGDLQQRFGGLTSRWWADPPHSAALVPIQSNVAHELAGYLVAGLSPRLPFDSSYRAFLELASAQIATSIGNARALQHERKRAEALAELDRAKTDFFSNVSHEFRTPLTLLLGPLEEVLAKRREMSGDTCRQIETAHRNGLRLLRLVNCLLDFSRIEAGRARALFESTDVCALTIELASSFRSAIEHAGLRLSIETPALAEPLYLDREMWEKIVLNLLSNAFKFTFHGEITVRLWPTGLDMELTVSDTGIGIPQEELPHIFERFHRVRSARGRTHEGTGIGLALVRELVHLHGGTVSAESALGKGSTFRVRIPFGKGHLPAEQIGGAQKLTRPAAHPDALVEEALQWSFGDGDRESWTPAEWADSSTPPHNPAAAPAGMHGNNEIHTGPRSKVLIVDDNADMRDYLRRMLSEQYNVTAARNGGEALKLAKDDPPDLVLADIMMPGLDGFGLLQALRANRATQTTPLIFLSARAGEEAGIEGMAAGADDYLVKPFSSRELLSRVAAHLKLARARNEANTALRESETRLSALFESLPAGVAVLDITGKVVLANREMRRYMPNMVMPSRDESQHGRWRARHPDGTPVAHNDFPGARALRGDAVIPGMEMLYLQDDGTEIWTNVASVPTRDSDDRINGFVIVVTNIDAQKRSEKALRETEKLAAVGRLASSIAHEINNPLEAMTNLLYLAENSAGYPEARDYLTQAQAELARVSSIAVETLRFHRQNTQAAAVSLNEILESVITLHQGRLRSAEIHVERRYRSHDPLLCYPNELRQVAANLIGNAVDAMNSCTPRRLSVRVGHGHDWRDGRPGARVTVADTGSGMSRNTQSRIFEPFFTTKETTGTGLGLWIAHDLVRKHEGTLRVRSRRGEPKHGTVFSIFLPYRDRQTIETMPSA